MSAPASKQDDSSSAARWWFKGAGILLGIAAGLVLAEGVCRLVFAPVPEVVIRYPADNPNYALTRPAPGDLVYEFVPGASLWGLSLNKLGLRDLERNVEKEPGAKRIICIGDSITMGGSSSDMVPLLQTWPLVLETVLSIRGGRRIEVWNAGIAGYNFVQYAAFLEQKAVNYEPDAILLGVCANDMAPAQVMHREGDQFVLEWYARVFPIAFTSLGLPLNRWLLENSHLFRALDIAAASLIPGEEEKIDLDAEKNHDALKKLRSMADRLNVPLAAVVFPLLGPRSDGRPSDAWKLRVIKDALRAEHIDFVDLSKLYSRFDYQRLRQTSQDNVHPNVLGHCLAAVGAYHELVDMGIRWIPEVNFEEVHCGENGLEALEWNH